LKAPEIPVINIPTSLSGGEYSPFAGATDKRTNHKAGFAHPEMGADLIILDPALSVSTPERIASQFSDHLISFFADFAVLRVLSGCLGTIETFKKDC